MKTFRFEGFETVYMSENPELTAIKLRIINNLEPTHKIIIENGTTDNTDLDANDTDSNDNTDKPKSLQTTNRKTKTK